MGFFARMAGNEAALKHSFGDGSSIELWQEKPPNHGSWQLHLIGPSGQKIFVPAGSMKASRQLFLDLVAGNNNANLWLAARLKPEDWEKVKAT